MTKIISIINNKGGVGKTTSTQNIACGLNQKGYSVGMVDFDPQANLTSSTQILEEKIDLRTALLAKKPLTKSDFSTTSRDNLFIIPNKQDTNSKIFAQFEIFEQTSILKNILKNDLFDFLIIDTPPNLDLQTYNTIVASHYLLIPVELEVFSIQGLQNIFDRVAQITSGGFSITQILGIFITQLDRRQSLNEPAQVKLDKDFKDKIFQSVIRVNSEFKKSQALKKDIWAYGDKKGIDDYTALIDELLSKI